MDAKVSMRPVTIVIGSVSPTYGAARVAIDMAEAFSRTRTVTVVTADGNAEENRAALNSAIEHIHLVRSPGVAGWVAYIVKLRRLLSARSAAHIFGFLTLTNLALSLSSIGSNYRGTIVLTEHNIQSVALKKFGRKFWIIVLAMRLAYPLSREVICVSEAVKSDLVGSLHIHRTRFRVVSNPIDGERIRELAKIAPNPDDLQFCNKSTIACVAELKPAKQQGLLVDAMVYVDFDFRLLLIGDGPDFDDLKRRITARNLNGRVVLLGRRNNPWPIVAKLGATILIPAYEGFGLSAAESAVVGTIPICGDTGGLGEIADQLGVPRVVLPGGYALTETSRQEAARTIAKTINETLHGSQRLDEEKFRCWELDHEPDSIASKYVSG